MLRHRLAATLLALACLPATAAAQPPYAGPWDPATEAAAEAAVTRMGAGRSLAIRPVVLQIVGLEGGIAGAGQGIVATVQEVRQAMAELGARETALEVKVDLPADVLFDFDSADVRPDAAQALAHLATVIRAYPTGRVQIEGHTDAKGNDTYNQRLSERRAASVKSWLTEREAIPADQLATRGAGESRPVAENTTDAGRQRNRRVEVVIQKSP